MPVPVSARSKAWVWGCLPAEIVGLNSSWWHVCLSVVSVVCCAGLRSLRRADHSSRGVLPNVVYRYVWSRNFVNEAPAHWGLLRQKKKTLCLKWDVNQRLSCSSELLYKSYANVLTLSLNIGPHSMQIVYIHNTAVSITAQACWSTTFGLNVWINMSPICIRAIFYDSSFKT